MPSQRGSPSSGEASTPSVSSKVPSGVDISAFSVPTEGRCPGAVVSGGYGGSAEGTSSSDPGIPHVEHTECEPDAGRRASHRAVEAERVPPGPGRGAGRGQAPVSRNRVIEDSNELRSSCWRRFHEGLALVIAQAMASVACRSSPPRPPDTEASLLTDWRGSSCRPLRMLGLAEAMDSLLADKPPRPGNGRRRPAQSRVLGGWIAGLASWWRPSRWAVRTGIDSSTPGDRRHPPHSVPRSALSPPGGPVIGGTPRVLPVRARSRRVVRSGIRASGQV